jgi:hypothetical protein
VGAAQQALLEAKEGDGREDCGTQQQQQEQQWQRQGQQWSQERQYFVLVPDRNEGCGGCNSKYLNGCQSLKIAANITGCKARPEGTTRTTNLRALTREGQDQ